MNYIRTFSALLVMIVIFISGCNTTQKPKKTWVNDIDSSTPKAKVSFLVERSSGEGTYFHIYHGSACNVEMDPESFDQDDYYFGVVSAPSSENSLPREKKIKHIEIPAGKMMSILMNSNETNHYRRVRSTCQFALEWIPEEGKEYLIGYSWSYDGCKIGAREFNGYGLKEIDSMKVYRYNRQKCCDPKVDVCI